MPPTSKIVVSLKIKGPVCKCGQNEFAESARPEPLSESFSASFFKPEETRTRPDYQPKVKSKDSEDSNWLKTLLPEIPEIDGSAPSAPLMMKNAKYVIDLTHLKESKTGQQAYGDSVGPDLKVSSTESMALRPSEVEFCFTQDNNLFKFGDRGHKRPSVLQKLRFIPNKLYNLGERGSGFKLKYGMQDFYELRRKCLDKGVLFRDMEFPPEESSFIWLRFNEGLKHYADNSVWKRPNDIVNNPQFLGNGYSRYDVRQGVIGDCWFLAAIAALTIYPLLFMQIVPDDQNFTEDYAGIFHFRFWQYGRWVDVVVDDHLPVVDDKDLIVLRSSEPNEFWPSLIEKAYAKLHNSYENIMGGFGIEALTDFTGGITESFDNRHPPENYFTILLKAYQRASVIASTINANSDNGEAVTPEGLILGHAYSITKVAIITLKDGQKVNMIRLKNPWGNQIEWNGPWSDGSNEWNSVSEAERQAIGLVFEHDGEFWMNFDDFLARFHSTHVCSLDSNDIVDIFSKKVHLVWQMSMYESEWVRGVTAGGAIHNTETFMNNPQFRITVTEVDENSKDGTCLLLIGLMQRLRRRLATSSAAYFKTMFMIFEIINPEEAPVPITADYLKNNPGFTDSSFVVSNRENVRRFYVKPGTYVIIPSTYNPNEEAEFLLRIFTETKIVLTENDCQGVQYSCRIEEKVIISDDLHQLFEKMAGEDGEVDFQELRTVLNETLAKETGNRGFSNDLCRSMITMVDDDLSGKLNYDEFATLWSYILYWKDVFNEFDRDRSGTFSAFELREAMESAGFQMNNRVLNRIMHRYGNKKGEINFEDFIMCAIKLKTTIDFFEYNADNNVVSFEIEEWLEYTMGAF